MAVVAVNAVNAADHQSIGGRKAVAVPRKKDTGFSISYQNKQERRY